MQERRITPEEHSQKRFTSMHDLVSGGLRAAFGESFEQVTMTFTEPEIAERLKPWVTVNTLQVNRMVGSRQGLSQDPMFVLRRLLGTIGLKLSRRQTMREGQRFMVYWLDEDELGLERRLGRLSTGYVHSPEPIKKNLRSEKSERDKMTNALRFQILERDGFTCRACGRNPRDHDGIVLHVDHIVPVSQGGKTEPGNLQSLCGDCNRAKGAKDVEQMTLWWRAQDDFTDVPT